MADAVVSVVLQQLLSVAGQEIQARVKLVKGVDEEVRKLKTNFEMLRAVLADAEQRQVTDTRVRVWLDKLKDVSYDMDEVLDTWNIAIMKRLQLEGSNDAHTFKSKVRSVSLSFYSGLRQVRLSHDIVSKIKTITRSLDDIAKEKDMFNFEVTMTSTHQRVESTSFVDVSDVHGRDKEANNLVSKLLDGSSKRQSGLHVISIVGMGGIGKTTLAQLAYNNKEVMNNFEERIWVCVSNPFDELMIAKAILEGLGGVNSTVVKLEAVIQNIRGLIIAKKILLVLDDVWTEDSRKWEPFQLCLKNVVHGSKVLVTTRKRTTAIMMESTDIIPMDKLSDDLCWTIFRRFAFSGWTFEKSQELEEIGMEIASKCKGLPLAAKTLGSLLRFKETRKEWENILCSEIWKVEGFEEAVFPPLLLSYYDLPSMVKRCFTYCAIFPKDFIFEKNELIRLWMAQGYLRLDNNEDNEVVGESCFNILANRSLFQEFEKDDDGSIRRGKMHDMVHDVAQFLSKNECFTMDVYDLNKVNMYALCEKAYQLMLMVPGNEELPISICNFKKLRSLLIKSRNKESRLYIKPKLFEELTSLKALQMSDNMVYISHIPKEIGKLVHLRYLDLSQNIALIKLSESLCELYNLQTLKIDGCHNLEALPQGIAKLINLRHLLNDDTPSLRYMPKGIERLTKLQTLTEFRWSDGDYSGKACSLDCFNNIRHMESLCIKGLNDSRGVMDEFGRLKNNENIRQLGLGFNWFREEDLKTHEAIIEAFQLPPNLQRLTIEDYRGRSMSRLRLTSLTNLRSIFMIGCTMCSHLPPLGKLQFLETLHIDSMLSVREVGNEFVGVERDDASSSSSSSSSSVTSFPKLKALQFQYMLAWEVWDFGIGDDATIRFMPSLHTLKLRVCDKLKGLPKQLLEKAPLQNLSIEGCPVLARVYENGIGDKWDHISHIPNVQSTLTFP